MDLNLQESLLFIEQTFQEVTREDVNSITYTV